MWGNKWYSFAPIRFFSDQWIRNRADKFSIITQEIPKCATEACINYFHLFHRKFSTIHNPDATEKDFTSESKSDKSREESELIKLLPQDTRINPKQIELNAREKNYATTPASYKDLVASDVFIDKTLLIKALIEYSSSALLITRPRRWGKTLNLDMLKNFLEIEVNENGIIEEEKINKSLFYWNGKPLNIMKDDYINTTELTKTLLFLYNEKLNQTEIGRNKSSAKKENAVKINKFIELLWQSENQEWLKIKETVLNNIRRNNRHSGDVIAILEKLRNDHYNAIWTNFSDLHSLIEKTASKMEEYNEKIEDLNSIEEKLLKEINEENKIKLNQLQLQWEQINKYSKDSFETLKHVIEETIKNWKSNNSNIHKFNEILPEFGFVNKYFGQYPVIFITFRNTSESEETITKKTLLRQLKGSVSRAFASHKYLYRYLILNCLEGFTNEIEIKDLSTNKLANLLYKLIREKNPEYKTEENYTKLELFKRLQTKFGIDASESDLENSLYFLTELLYQYFGRKVFILIDEYDAPLNSAYNKTYYEGILNIFREILSRGMKNNERVKKSIITGIMKIVKANLFSGLNNFDHYGVLDNKFSEYFGFTESEVDKLLANNLLGDPEEKEQQKKKIKSWYNGYTIGEHIIYNPFSIMLCLQWKEIKEFWINSGSDNILKERIEAVFWNSKFNLIVQKLIKRETVSINLLENYSHNTKEIFFNMRISNLFRIFNCFKLLKNWRWPYM